METYHVEVEQDECARDESTDNGKHLLPVGHDADDPKNQRQGKRNQDQQPSKGRNGIASARLQNDHEQDRQARRNQKPRCRLAISHGAHSPRNSRLRRLACSA
jgi:hypothetical protein